MSAFYGWHFLPADRRLCHGDRRLVRAGRTYRCDEPAEIEMCKYGMHASRRAIDAIGYAPGPIVCRVRLSGSVHEEGNKAVAAARHVLWIADATGALFDFACWVAEAALIGQLTQGRAVDPASWEAISTRRRYQRGEAREVDLLAAESAARLAARLAAESAARLAAESAARLAAASAAESAAKSAAWSAARLAAASAAWSAAESAAWSAARDLQNAELERRLCRLRPRS